MTACKRCQAENPAKARFCLECGVALAEPGTLFEERKLVSVLFVDVVGSTAQADRADPEDIRDRLRIFYERVRAQIDRFGGTTEKFIGDAVVAVFGAPTATGDDAERAVRCGLSVIEAISELGREHPDLALAVRAAVATGEAVVALGFAFERGEALATGDVVNTAARLQAAAPVASLVVDGETFKATRRNVSYEALPPVVAKGKREPLEAWLAVPPRSAHQQDVHSGTLATSSGPSSSQAAEPRSELSALAPVVGREHELALARSVWEAVCEEGRARSLTILGHAGIGKSRLGIEIERLSAGSGGRVARGRSLPFGEDSGYGGFAQQLLSLAGVRDTDPPLAARGKLSALVAEHLPDAAPIAAEHLSLLLGLHAEGSAADQQSLFFSARRLVEALGVDQPLLLLFEDLHWADESLLDLLSYLIARVDAPVLFVVLARPELLDRRTDWAQIGGADALMSLGPLDATASVMLVEHLRGGESELSRSLAERSEGNPLFIEELVAAASERDADSSAELPTTVRATIAARLDALPAPARSILLEASVAGSEFWRGVLSEPVGVTTDEALEMLSDRDLVRREPKSRIEGDQQFTFKHMLIRDVAYATLPRSVRRTRHAAVAAFIERTAGSRIAESSATLGHHWREAGEIERAIDAFELAGDTALNGWAKGEAVTLFGEALALVPSDRPDRRREIELKQSRALMANGDYQRAAELIDGLLSGLSGREELEATMDRTKAASWLTSAEDVRRFGSRSAELAEALGVPQLSAPALGYISQISSMEGRCLEMIEIGEKALSIWPAGHLPAEKAYQLEMVGLTQTWVGRFDEAEANLEASIGLAEDCHSVEAMLRAGATIGLALVGLGRHEEALRRFDEAISRGREMEFLPRFTARALNMSSSALRDLMDLDAARRRNEEAIELGHRAGFSLAWIQGGIDLLEADLLDDEASRAARAWPALWEQTESTQGFHQWLMAGRLLVARARLDLILEAPEIAAASAIRAKDHAEATERPKQVIAAKSILGAAFMRVDRQVAAGLKELQEAAAMATTLGHPPTTWRAFAAKAEASASIGDEAGADEAWGQVRASIATMASGLDAARRALFESAPEIARLIEAR
jgi:class 3 adenylate cyclase/tetratricopeptide (TPR) repeat protein